MNNEEIKVIAERQELVDIADAVREKTGDNKSMGIGEIARNIRGMSTGGVINTQSKTVSPTEEQQEVTPDSGYNGLSKVTVNAIESDYVGSNVPRENAKNITPTKSSQVAVFSGTYVNGDISVEAIPDEYITTTDADAIAEEIALNKIAYVDGKKVVGSFTIENEVSNQEEIISTQDEMIASIVNALEGKAAGGSGVSIPTCTVGFGNEIYGGGSTSSSAKLKCYVSVLNNNIINTIETEEVGALETTTDILNVVCGSLCVAECNQSLNGYKLIIYDNDSGEYIKEITLPDVTTYCFQAPSNNGNFWIYIGLA